MTARRQYTIDEPKQNGKEGKRYGTVGKGLEVLLEVRLGALATRTDRNGKVLVGGAARRELI